MLCRSGFLLNCEPHMHLIAFVVRISMLDNLCIQLLETDWLDSKEITIEIVEQHWNNVSLQKAKKAAPLMLQKQCFTFPLYLLFEQKMKANQSMLKWDNIWDTHLSTNQHTLLSFLNPSLISGILAVIIAHYRQAFYAIASFTSREAAGHVLV